MIHIDRSKSKVPEILQSRLALNARKEAADFYGRTRSKRTQERHRFQEELWRKVTQDLRRLFRGKCAYCEKRFTKSEIICINHFRPTSHAKQLGGESSTDHYWWLAYEYDNLYPACMECHKHKATIFPVIGKRATEGEVGKALHKEKALLIDPCVENPQEYLYFLKNGQVVPVGKGRNQESRAKRARSTIDILGLNRSELVKARAKVMEEITVACIALSRRRRRLVGGTGAAMSHPAARVKKLLASWLPFGAARRQVAHEELKRMGGFGEQVISLVPELAMDSGKKSLAHPQVSRIRKRGTAYIRELVISNFKTIRKLTLTFEDSLLTSSGDLSLAGWRVFVGENGAGKSSILQALALALAGETQVRNVVINWDKILRRPRGNRQRAREGFVKIILSTGVVIKLVFNKKSAWFESGGEGALTALRAYGTTRNLPNTRAPASWKSVEAMIRIINLFDPYSPLCNAEGWIASLSADRFEVVALALKDLLQLQPGDRIRREKRKDTDSGRYVLVPIVDIGNSSNRLDELSDGYQSMIALAIDIMAGLPKKTTDFQTDTGIVIIDELGNHLHPTWRMQVVASLRRTFPRMQFVVTTHDPLCLRGLEVGEIAVLRREKGSITAQIINDSIAHLRADQLLTSPLFGLVGTRDPIFLRASRKDEQHYDMLFLKKNRSDEEEIEFQQLCNTIVQRTADGETSTERFVEQAVHHALEELNISAPDTLNFEESPAPEAIQLALKAKFTELLKIDPI